MNNSLTTSNTTISKHGNPGEWVAHAAARWQWLLGLLCLFHAGDLHAQAPSAPSGLSGLKIVLTTSELEQYTAKFAATTFTAVEPGLTTGGNYSYVKLNSTQGRAVLNTTSPPGESGVDQITFTFTGLGSGSFVDNYDYGFGDAGTATGTFFIAPPTVTTSAATSITATGARLNASINPNGSSTIALFEYGPTAAYGFTAPVTLLPDDGTTAQNVNATIGGLQPGTTYYFRALAINNVVAIPGSELTFKTPGLPPTVTTLAATGVATGGATLNASINPNGLVTTAHFEYGPTTAYGFTIAFLLLPANGTTAQNVFNGITGLSPGTTYHFRAVAVNSVGTTHGGDVTFTTPTPTSFPPIVTNLAATGVSTTGATLNASINPNGNATVAQFHYGTTTNYGSTAAITLAPNNGTTVQNASVSIAGLAANTTYYYLAVASNSFGGAAGSDLTFKTLAVPPAITAPPLSRTVVAGSNVVLTVTATGTAPLAYQWRTNGIAISGQTGATLSLPNVMLHQGGLYTVVVTNAGGSVTSAPPANLTVTSGIFESPVAQDATAIQTQGFVLKLLLEVGRSFRVQASTNLQTWSDLTNFTSSGMAFQFVDAAATNQVRRFYRVISP